MFLAIFVRKLFIFMTSYTVSKTTNFNSMKYKAKIHVNEYLNSDKLKNKLLNLTSVYSLY